MDKVSGSRKTDAVARCVEIISVSFAKIISVSSDYFRFVFCEMRYGAGSAFQLFLESQQPEE